MSRVILFLALLSIPFKQGFSGEVRMTPGCREAYESIFALQFDQAWRQIDQLMRTEPDNPMVFYLRTHHAFVRHLVTGAGSDRSEFTAASRQTWTQLDKAGIKNAWYYYLSGTLHMQEAVFLFDDGQTASAGLKLKKAYQYYGNALAIDSRFPPAKLERSVLEILFSSLPDEYGWIVKVLGLYPDQKRAFNDLMVVSDSIIHSARYRFLTVPSFTLQGYLLRNYSRSKPQIESMLTAMEKHLARHSRYKSPLLIYTKAKALNTLGRNAEAMTVLDSYIITDGENHFPYIYLMRAESRLSRLDGSIDRDCKLFITHFKGVDFVKRTYQLLAWEALLDGDTSRSQRHYKAVLQTGRAKYEDDIQAQREAEQGRLPNAHLLKARLLYDGGEHDRALGSLLSAPPSKVCHSIEEQMEYFYRLARIHQALENYDKALQFFSMVVDMGRDSKRYFAGNASLQMGLIYEMQGRNDKARESFNLCLRLPFQEYRKSIQQRAKAGLSRLK